MKFTTVSLTFAVLFVVAGERRTPLHPHGKLMVVYINNKDHEFSCRICLEEV